MEKLYCQYNEETGEYFSRQATEFEGCDPNDINDIEEEQ